MQIPTHKNSRREGKSSSTDNGGISTMDLKVNDIVLCTVRVIEKTAVFVDIEGFSSGTIIMSEVAAGRIRNLREYVSPNKKIVCKVLNISGENIQLSLRRVTGKERELAMDKFKKEKAFSSLLKTIVSEPKSIIDSIKEKYDLIDFLEEAKKGNIEILLEFFKKEEAEKLKTIFLEKEEKGKKAKSTFILKTSSSNGLEELKDILNVKADIKYLGSSKFVIETTGKDFKEANNSLCKIIKDIEAKAKVKRAFFETKE